MLKVITLILISTLTAIPAFAGDHSDKSLISVTGEARLLVKPDEVHVAMTVDTSSKNLKKAQQQNDEISAKLLRVATTKLRIDESNIQTNFVNIRPIYEYNNCGQKRCSTSTLTRYENKKSFLIKLTNIDSLQDLLEEAVEIGVTRVDSIKFASSKEDILKQKVQIEAATNARSQAQKVATALGVGVGSPHRINFHTSAPIQKRGGIMAMSALESSSTISPGQLTISANVNIDFEIVK